MINTKKEVSVNFSIKYDVPFSKAVYLVGSVPELGEWQCKNAHKLRYSYNGHWNTSIRMKKYPQVQYKFFVSDFNQVNMNDIQWENIEGNRKLQFSETSNEFLSSVLMCSFNIKMHTEKGEGSSHWDDRKEKIVQYFTKHAFDFIGIQDASEFQRKFLEQKLSSYDYFGVKRQLQNDGQCGIFVQKDRFLVLQDHYDWVSETSDKSFDDEGNVPRYFTSLVIAPKIFCFDRIKVPCFLVVNVNLDNLGLSARKNGINQICKKCIQIRKDLAKSEAYDLVGCVIMGDFKEPENSPHLNILRKNEEMPFQSMRKIKGADHSLTYNGYLNKFMLKFEQIFIGNLLTVDHMFYWMRENAPIMPIKFEVDKQEKREQYLSDHFPIVGEFLKEPELDKLTFD